MRSRPEPMSSLDVYVAWLVEWLRETNPHAPTWVGVKIAERDNKPYAPFIGEPVSLSEFEPRFNALRADGYSWLNLVAVGKDGPDLIIGVEHALKPVGIPADKVSINFAGISSLVSASPDWQIKDLSPRK